MIHALYSLCRDEIVRKKKSSSIILCCPLNARVYTRLLSYTFTFAFGVVLPSGKVNIELMVLHILHSLCCSWGLAIQAPYVGVASNIALPRGMAIW